VRVTVTGGAGFIGVHLVQALCATGHQVQVIDNHSVGGAERLAGLPLPRLDVADIRDAEGIRTALNAFRPTTLVHLAAIHFIPYCDAHPLEALDVNVQGTAIVMREAIAAGASRLVVASSLAVYPPRNEEHLEDETLGPMDIYGYSKWQAELVVKQAASEHGLPCAIARIANVFGPMETNPHVIPRIIDQLKSGDELKLGNLDSRRDYVYVEDVAEALAGLATGASPCTGAFNLSTGQAYSVQDILDQIGKLLDRPVAARSLGSLLRPVDRPMLRANSSRLTAATRWTPRFTLRDGLRALLLAEGLLGEGADRTVR
jgi:UDP-glucose 4-epimerase